MRVFLFQGPSISLSFGSAYKKHIKLSKSSINFGRARCCDVVAKMAAIGDADENLKASVCPITNDWMRDPYYCAVDGHTYEKVAIVEWVAKNHNSPLTQQRVELKDLCKCKSVQRFKCD